MVFVKKIWHCILLDPFTWLGACIFRPYLFKRAFENRPERRKLLLRLFLPILILSYPFALIFFELSFPFAMVAQNFYPLVSPWPLSISAGESLLIALATTSLGIGAGLWLGDRLGLVWSIVTGIAGGVVLGAAGEGGWLLASSSQLDLERGLLVGALTAVTGGFLGSVAGMVAGYIGLNIRLGIISGIIGGLIGGTSAGLLGGISAGVVAGMILGILSAILGGMGRGILASMGKGHLINMRRRLLPRLFRRNWQNGKGGVAAWYTTGVEVGAQIGIPVGILCGILMRVLSNIPIDLPFFSLQEKGAGFAWGFAITPWDGFVWGSALGLIAGSACGIWLGIAMGSAEGLAWGLALGTATCLAYLIASLLSLAFMGILTGGIAWGIGLSILAALTFMLCYPVGCYRWPLYPISAFSSLRAYFRSRKNPLKVFNYLKHSSLYWDESEYPLPLPRSEHLLMCAVEQDSEKALKELIVISHKRPSQINATEAPTHEIAMRNLEKCSDLRQIAAVSKRLTELKAIHLEWMAPFAIINIVSEKAALYLISRQQDTLKEMRENLEKISPSTIFENNKLGERLNTVAKHWQVIVQLEEGHLNTVAKNWQNIVQIDQPHHIQGIGRLDNPYCPGPVLSETNSPFVGRQDLVEILEAELKKGRERIPLMLWGERRMGKSSTLQQLPYLLKNPQNISIFYDLQSIPATSSTPALLFTIADGIQNALHTRDIQIEPLWFERLQEAGRESEAAVYRVFDEWLKNIERVLEKRDQILLLLFDEFEKLIEVAEGQYLDLRLLLNWFRHIVQHRPRLALLFSGLQSIGKMPPTARIRWTDYFVNFQTYKVTFLRPAEARLLITRPVRHFPAEHIFHEDVVEEIMHVTGRHPFLVQAVCSMFIEHLNSTGRGKAELDDISIVIDQVLERCGDTYFLELWDRTNQVQRNCMLALNRLREADIQEVAQSISLNETIVGEAFFQLHNRDLLSYTGPEKKRYRLAIPLFSHWLRSGFDFSQL